MCNRNHPDYYTYDMLSDILSNGRSSRLIQRLVQEKKIFTNIDAYIAGSLDEGMFYVTGKCNEGISFEEAEKAVWNELDNLKKELVVEHELEKVKNRYESEQIFSNINYLNVATNLAYFELVSKAEELNNEVDKYRSVTAQQIQDLAKKCFVPENCCVLYYKANQKQQSSVTEEMMQEDATDDRTAETEMTPSSMEEAAVSTSETLAKEN